MPQSWDAVAANVSVGVARPESSTGVILAATQTTPFEDSGRATPERLLLKLKHYPVAA